MSKKSLVIDDFSGGLTNDPSKTDLLDNEAVTANNLDLSKDGAITIIGNFANVTATSWSSKVDAIATISPGYGLYVFSSDYDPSGSVGFTDYILFAGKSTANHKRIQIFSTTGGVMDFQDTTENYVTIASSDTSAFYPTFYYIDNSLRVFDGNHASTKSVSKLVTLVNSTHFSGTTHATSYAGWYIVSLPLASPTSGVVSRCITGTNVDGTPGSTHLNSSGTAGDQEWTSGLVGHSIFDDSDSKLVLITAFNSATEIETQTISTTVWATYNIFPIANANNANVDITVYGSTVTFFGDAGSFVTGRYKFGISHIFSDGQESPVKELEGHIDAGVPTSDGTAPYTMTVTFLLHGSYSPWISGLRLYGKNDYDDDGTWYYLATCDLERGVYVDLVSPSYTTFNLRTPASATTGTINSILLYAGVNIKGLGADTYNSITGRLQSTGVTVSGKSVVIANRTAYLGNVKINGIVSGDAILKSLPNKFDTFDTQSRIDVAIGDGDEIVAIEEYADRILQFKNRNLYIVNIAQDIEFLEAQHDYMGVAKPNHVTRTDLGIAWVNNRGCFLYNGNAIVDLLKGLNDQSRRKIDTVYWNSFLGNNPSIGYSPIDRKLLVLAESSGTSLRDLMIFDMEEGAWTRAISKLGSTILSIPYSNFIVDENNLCYIFDGNLFNLKYWNSSSTVGATTITWESKEFNFDSPGIDQSLYKIYVTHKNSNNRVQVYYRTNGTSDLYSTTTGTLPNSTSFITSAMTPASTTASRNIKTFSIVFKSSGDVPYNFEIDNVEVIYRILGTR